MAGYDEAYPHVSDGFKLENAAFQTNHVLEVLCGCGWIEPTYDYISRRPFGDRVFAVKDALEKGVIDSCYWSEHAQYIVDHYGSLAVCEEAVGKDGKKEG